MLWSRFHIQIGVRREFTSVAEVVQYSSSGDFFVFISILRFTYLIFFSSFFYFLVIICFTNVLLLLYNFYHSSLCINKRQPRSLVPNLTGETIYSLYSQGRQQLGCISHVANFTFVILMAGLLFNSPGKSHPQYHRGTCSAPSTVLNSLTLLCLYNPPLCIAGELIYKLLHIKAYVYTYIYILVHQLMHILC